MFHAEGKDERAGRLMKTWDLEAQGRQDLFGRISGEVLGWLGLGERVLGDAARRGGGRVASQGGVVER